MINFSWFLWLHLSLCLCFSTLVTHITGKCAFHKFLRSTKYAYPSNTTTMTNSTYPRAPMGVGFRRRSHYRDSHELEVLKFSACHISWEALSKWSWFPYVYTLNVLHVAVTRDPRTHTHSKEVILELQIFSCFLWLCLPRIKLIFQPWRKKWVPGTKSNLHAEEEEGL